MLRCTSYVSILEVIFELQYDNWQDTNEFDFTNIRRWNCINSVSYKPSPVVFSKNISRNLITKCASEIFFSLDVASAASLDIIDILFQQYIFRIIIALFRKTFLTSTGNILINNQNNFECEQLKNFRFRMCNKKNCV